MATTELPSHLSQIETRWTELFQAHLGPPDAAAPAQAALMLRYAGAVLRYLVKATGDPHLAEDLAQDFAVRFLRGDFRHADPSKGRFRNFVKRAVLNLMVDHHRRRRSRPHPLEEGVPEPAVPGADPAAIDRTFLDSWREQVMAHAWDALAEQERRAGQFYHTVLRFRADHPDLHSPRMAEILSERLGRPVTAVWVRQVLFQARERFVDLVIAEVARTLKVPSREGIEQELIALDLLEYCRSGLERYGDVTG
jgi:RNA polymerase sigma-70 factor (ECF subfamily)